MDADQPPLPMPRTPAGRQGLDALLDNPGRALVALDFDGTLSPIVDDPSTSRLVDGGLDALRRLATVVAHIAILTGRPAQTVVRLGGLDAVPGVIVEGQYGQEQWRDGTLHVPEQPEGIQEVRAALPAIVDNADPGVWIEDKGLSLVVHTRRAADPDGALVALVEPLRSLAERHGLDVSPGRYVLEIRKPGEDKGRTLLRIVREFRPGAVLFAGDDVGDLPAFDVVELLRRENVPGLSVCSASREAPAVAARADVVVDGPPGVATLLAEIAAAAERRNDRR